MNTLTYILLGAFLLPHPGMLIEHDGTSFFTADFQGNLQLASAATLPDESMHATFIEIRYIINRDQNINLFTIGYRYEIHIVRAKKSIEGYYKHLCGIRAKNILSVYPSFGITFSEKKYLYREVL